MQRLTKAEFLDEYSEKTTTPQGIGNKYQYNETDGYIYHYHASGQITKSLVKFDNREEAENHLIEHILLNHNHYSGRENLFIGACFAKDLLKEVEMFLDYGDEDNASIIKDLERIKKELLHCL